MHLDHATLVTADLAAARRFFVDVVGLEEGARPPFRVDGHWLYASGRPVIHLVEGAAPTPAQGRLQPGVSPRIDHIAFRIDTAEAWQALLQRVQTAQVASQLSEVPLSGELQLFVALAPGVVIEFVTALTVATSANHRDF
jgi:catechol 2,3-dioxygenase-like lactoylglutathione lyase family enzyme